MARISFSLTAAVILFAATSMVAKPLGARADEAQRAARPGNAEVTETDGKGDAEKAGGRILHFPRDRSLGRLWVYESDANLAQLDERACVEARGDVDVPAGKLAGLHYVDSRIKKLAADQPWDLSSLDDLRPTDLDFLMFVFARLPTDELKRLTRHTSLRMLSIGISEMNEDSLASIGKLSSLEALTFGEIKISDKGLAHLKDLHNLRRLHLGSGGITNDGLPHLAKLNKLEELDLTWASITDAGLPHLAHLKNMQHLQLGRTNISGPGLVHLAGMKSLQQLDLTDTQITDQGLAHLKTLRNLRSLDLSRTKVTEAGVAALRKQLPETTILSDFAAQSQARSAEPAQDVISVMSGDADRIVVVERPKNEKGEPKVVATLKGPKMDGLGGILAQRWKDGWVDNHLDYVHSWIVFLKQVDEAENWPRVEPITAKHWAIPATDELIAKVRARIPTPADWSNPVDGLAIGLRPKLDTFAVGDAVAVEIAIKNTCKEPRRILNHRMNIYDYWPHTRFEVTTPDGHGHYLLDKPIGAILESDALTPRTLAPGEVYIHTVRLRDWPYRFVAKDGDENGPSASDGRLFSNAGEYRITGLYERPSPERDVKEGEWYGRLRSLPLSVRVAAATADENDDRNTGEPNGSNLRHPKASFVQAKVVADELAKRDAEHAVQLCQEMTKIAVPAGWNFANRLKIAPAVSREPRMVLVIESGTALPFEHIEIGAPARLDDEPERPPVLARVEIRLVTMPYLSLEERAAVAKRNEHGRQQRLEFERQYLQDVAYASKEPLPIPPWDYRIQNSDEKQLKLLREYIFLWLRTEPVLLPTHHYRTLAFKLETSPWGSIREEQKMKQYRVILAALQQIVVPYDKPASGEIVGE